MSVHLPDGSSKATAPVTDWMPQSLLDAILIVADGDPLVAGAIVRDGPSVEQAIHILDVIKANGMGGFDEISSDRWEAWVKSGSKINKASPRPRYSTADMIPAAYIAGFLDSMILECERRISSTRKTCSAAFEDCERKEDHDDAVHMKSRLNAQEEELSRLRWLQNALLSYALGNSR